MDNSAAILQEINEVPWLTDVCSFSEFVACDDDLETHCCTSNSPDEILEDLMAVNVNDIDTDNDDGNDSPMQVDFTWPEALQCAEKLRNFILQQVPSLSEDVMTLEAKLENAQLIMNKKTFVQTSLDSWIVHR